MSMVDNFKVCFPSISNVAPSDRLIKWNNNNLAGVILNVDGSCMDSLIRIGYGGVLGNNTGFYLSSFYGFIHGSSDILYAELCAIYKGLLLAKYLEIINLVCYSDSLHCINLIKGPFLEFHVYVVLIQDIKELIEQSFVTVHHTLTEGNKCADYMAKLGASFNNDITIHPSSPDGLLNLLEADDTGTLFPRE